MPEALPAVTVPSLAKAGRSFAIASSVAPCLRIFVGIDHDVALAASSPSPATISSLNLPAFCAASALFCDFDRELVLLLRG